MPTTTIRVREPRELLALLPYQLGFRPERSAVAVALRPPRGRVGLVARVDLTDLAEPERGPALARRLVTHLVGDGAARAVLALYVTADPRPWLHAAGAAPDGPPVGGVPTGAPTGGAPAAEVPLEAPTDTSPTGSGRAAGEALSVRRAVAHFREAAAGFLGEVAVWAVGPQGYLSLDCADPACCPPGGRPLRELQSTEVGAHMVLAGAMVADSRETLVPDVAAPAPARRNARRAAARARVRRARAEADGPRALADWRVDAVGAWRAQLAAARPGGAPPAAAALGRIGAALGDAAVRDAVLLTLVRDAGDLPERSVAAGGPADATVAADVARALGVIVSPREGAPPEPATVAAATALLEAVAGHARGAERAPALTLLGLLAWWHGDGARAAVLLERALAADPAHRLAHLLVEALAAGLAPGCARARA